MSGTQPLGSAVFQAMTLDATVNEVLSLHGENGLSWSQVYDMIEFLGGVDGIVKAGCAEQKADPYCSVNDESLQTSRQPKELLAAVESTRLAEASEFARTLLRRYLSSRLLITPGNDSEP
jgi:hypothetical protein